MPIGRTGWSCQEVADARGVAVTKATTTLRRFDRQARTFLAAARRLQPDVRADRLAEQFVAMLTTGGALSRLDRRRLLDHVRRLAAGADP